MEFTVGRDAAGAPAVGFLYGRFADGYTAVAAPQRLPNVSRVAKAYAALLAAFLRSGESRLPVWDKSITKGEVRCVVRCCARCRAEHTPLRVACWRTQ